MPYVQPCDRPSFEEWLRRIGKPIPELTRPVADSVWTEYLASEEAKVARDLRARALFDAMNCDTTRNPDWTIQPEHIKDVFRGKASLDMHVHTGTGVVYRWSAADSTYNAIGRTNGDEGQ